MKTIPFVRNRLEGYPEHIVNRPIPLHVETSSKGGNTSIRTEGQLTTSGLGDEVAELDDDGTHVLDVLCTRRLGGTGGRGRAQAGTSVGNAGALVGRHTARCRARSGRRCRR